MNKNIILLISVIVFFILCFNKIHIVRAKEETLISKDRVYYFEEKIPTEKEIAALLDNVDSQDNVLGALITNSVTTQFSTAELAGNKVITLLNDKIFDVENKIELISCYFPETYLVSFEKLRDIEVNEYQAKQIIVPPGIVVFAFTVDNEKKLWYSFQYFQKGYDSKEFVKEAVFEMK
ncbi:hypothetical protein [Victivallis sp. Marseille-Q1083]|uniref:hypothetical protein n=1 Tax=Victivallis sp. Marseille-Q1083 TaxID=2717288 RepID=UPI00158A6440|nr:hypothetical protein [Victivallis sp. Marseille-Q1083]